MKVTWSRVINPDWSLSDEDRTLAKWSLVLSATSNVPSTGPNSMVRDNRRSELRYLSMWWSALTVHRPLHLIRHESKPGNNESHIFDPSELFSAAFQAHSVTISYGLKVINEVQLKRN